MITLVYTYYNAPRMLQHQLEYWLKYSQGIDPSSFRIILVDDGSKEFPAIDVIKDLPDDSFSFPFSLFCIEEDIFNNVSGARNLGWQQIDDGWGFNLDIDHAVPLQTLKYLIPRLQDLCPSCAYIPRRWEAMGLDGGRGAQLRPHSDTFIMTEKKFWELGGYDERYRQYYYNGSCKRFRQDMKTYLKRVEDFDHNVYTIFYPNVLIDDASPLTNQPKEKHEPGMPIFEFEKTTFNFNWKQLI